MQGAPFRVDLITLVPDLWPQLLAEETGLVGKAFAPGGQAKLSVHSLRDYGKGIHRQVDDAPFGGGAGMVLQVEPLHRAIEDVRAENHGPVVLLSPRGAPFNQAKAHQLAAAPGMALVCGRYEGVDERVRRYIDQEICVGDYVLSAGDPAAWIIVDAVVRLLPGVLGNPDSLHEESFASGHLEYPHYTRPAEYDGVAVPEVLRSGDHQAIARWRREQGEALTRKHRPDLIDE